MIGYGHPCFKLHPIDGRLQRVEDRFLMIAPNTSGAQAAFLVTRRLTARLINSIAGLLERSNIAASKAPEEMRSDIVLMEHQGLWPRRPKPPPPAEFKRAVVQLAYQDQGW